MNYVEDLKATAAAMGMPCAIHAVPSPDGTVRWAVVVGRIVARADTLDAAYKDAMKRLAAENQQLGSTFRETMNQARARGAREER